MGAFLSNPADFLGSGALAVRAAPRRQSPTYHARATHATVRGARLVRRAAVARFGRGKTQLVYQAGRWVAFVQDAHGTPVGTFLAFDSSPGVAGTGVDFQLQCGPLPGCATRRKR